MNSKKIIRIVEDYSEKAIEGSIVKLFLSRNNIHVKHNSLILDALSHADDSLVSYIESESPMFELIDFVQFFELLIPASDKKLNGAFFTPENITSFMVDLVKVDGESSYIDPSCGCGAFLFMATEKIR